MIDIDLSLFTLYNNRYRVIARVPELKECLMTYLAYAALLFIGLAATICFIRSYRPVVNGKISRRLVDLGLTFSLLFVGLVIAANASVTMHALVTGSIAMMVFIAIVGLIGFHLFVVAAFYVPLRRVVKAAQVRRQEHKLNKEAEDRIPHM